MIILASIDRVAFRIGSLTVEWYGIILTTAILLGLLYVMHEAPRIGLTKDDILELFLWCIPLAVIFARLVYIIPRADEYFPWNSWDAFVNAWAIWEGGITIIGGILGGVIGGVIFWARHKKRVNFGQLVDLVMPALLFSQAFGRWGNFINQEAFGVAITNPNLQWFPFAVYIDRAVGFADGWYAATFFYEMVYNFIGAIIFFVVWRKNKKYPGILGFAYVAWYFFIRALLEYIRLDAVPETQILSFILFPLAIVGGVLYILYRNRKLKNNPTLELADGIVNKTENAVENKESGETKDCAKSKEEINTETEVQTDIKTEKPTVTKTDIKTKTKAKTNTETKTEIKTENKAETKANYERKEG